jgi:hypothetical protein
MQRVMDHFHLRRALTWDQPSKDVCLTRLRRGVREKLGGVPDDPGKDSKALPLADAQILVARSLGFKDWDRLVSDLEA